MINDTPPKKGTAHQLFLHAPVAQNMIVTLACEIVVGFARAQPPSFTERWNPASWSTEFGTLHTDRQNTEGGRACGMMRLLLISVSQHDQQKNSCFSSGTPFGGRFHIRLLLHGQYNHPACCQFYRHKNL